MSKYNEYNDNEYLDYADEIQEESKSKKGKKENRSVMKDINRELKSLKSIEFKDFNIIMNTYNKGNEKLKIATEEAFDVLKGLVVTEMFSEKYINESITDFSDDIFNCFKNSLSEKLRMYKLDKTPKQYFQPYIDEAIETVIEKNKKTKNKSTPETIKNKYDYNYSIENPTIESMTDIMKLYNEGDRIRKTAIDDACLNLKGFIIYMIMHKFWTYCKSHFFDMLQCGYIGVLKGLENYDTSKGMPTTFFKTYIICEITRYITEFLNGSTVHYATTLSKVKRAQRHFEEIGVEAKESALAEFLGISPTSVREALASQEAAINVNYQDEFENSSDDDIPSSNSKFMNPEKYLESKALNDAIMDAMENLTKYEKMVIIMHYGLEGSPMTFRQISEEIGFSFDRIKFLHQSAINKMHSEKLGALYDENYKTIPGMEVYEFIPESEEEMDIVEFTFEDFMDAKAFAYTAIEEEKNGAGSNVPVLSDYAS